MRLSCVALLFVVSCSLASAGRAEANEPAPPRCLVDGIGFPAVRLPANAPLIPLVDHSAAGARASLAIAPLQDVTFVTGPAEPTHGFPETYLPARPSGLLPEGKHTLSWTLSCTPGAAPLTGERHIEVLPPAELPTGSFGSLIVLPVGHAARITLSPSSAAYAQVSTFIVRYEGRAPRPNAAPPARFGFGGAIGDTLDIGFAAPDDAVGGSALDLRQQLVYARSGGAGFCKGDEGIEDFDFVVEQHVAGAAGAPPPTVRGTLHVDCARAASLDSEGIDCSVGRAPGSRGPGHCGGLVAALGGLAVLLTRARRHYRTREA